MRDARVLATRCNAKGRVVVVSFFAPAVRAWFTLDGDRRTFRTSQLEMTAAAHCMRHRHSGFDAPARVEPSKMAGRS